MTIDIELNVCYYKTPQIRKIGAYMKGFNNLSKEYIAIDEIMSHRVSFDLTNVKAKLGWNDCAAILVESGLSWNYFKICLQKNKVITVNKSSTCQIRKVKRGLFKDSYCVVDTKDGGNSYTILYVFDKSKILKYPEINKCLNEEEIDLLLDQKQIEKIAARLLNQFDISKTHQEYESFCNNLPNACWKKKDFAKNVLAIFDEMGETELQTNVDKKFVKLNLCKQIARKFFTDLSAIKKQEREL